MEPTTEWQEQLFENRLAFLASHRGAVTRAPDRVVVKSDRPEFSFVAPGASCRAESFRERPSTILHLPWCPIVVEQWVGAGYVPSGSLTFMELEQIPERSKKWRVSNDLEISHVSDEEAMSQFSDVQCRGFNEQDEAYQRWHGWLDQANQRNLSNADQAFYVGVFGGESVGTALAVVTGEVVGIYALATLSRWRKRGVSARLMREAVGTALNGGCTVATLQAETGSYAEKLYRHMGFKAVFVATTLKYKAP